ncbi:hypothetical protein M419DRAFT_5239 [Trichoderma reesei RUT C-30]|uniref:Uncharacterized protein n=1 Tax=Hypocrea jecorina (strain ATCC 56765 / BCRC 32924 / NRRL 11460 / Rut C-30) TaxID=1344414 RepID=A0A024SNJ8_HYPJR|nr:hypothetical protein M419DRAFT_5239 [Trichoderma reesei RUT C-30]
MSSLLRAAAEADLFNVSKPVTSHIAANRPSMLTMLPCCITHIVMAGAEYEYCPFMFWYPPAVCYYKRFGPGVDEDEENEGAATDGRDIKPHGDIEEKDSNGATQPQNSRLLSLPVEIRLRIYYWAYRMSPIQPKELAAGYPIPMLCRYVLHPLDPDLEKKIEEEIEAEEAVIELAKPDESGPVMEGSEGSQASQGKWEKMKAEQERKKLVKERTKERMRELNRNTPGLLSSERPLAGIPTNLLRTCRQIYFEAREVPFAENEFVFLNWFSSGLNAASAVTKSQRPWQRLAMRYARLEIMAEDLARKAALSKWADLCSPGRAASWTRGLRGLRVKVVGQIGRRSTDDQKDDDEFVDGLEEAGGARRWVEGGRLAEMENLERLEIEIIKNSWSTEDKIAWCAAVQDALREKGSNAVVAAMGRIL